MTIPTADDALLDLFVHLGRRSRVGDHRTDGSGLAAGSRAMKLQTDGIRFRTSLTARATTVLERPLLQSFALGTWTICLLPDDSRASVVPFPMAVRTENFTAGDLRFQSIEYPLVTMSVIAISLSSFG